MSITLTLYLWWAIPYLAVGVLMWFPLQWWYWHRLVRPGLGFWADLKASARQRGASTPVRIAVQVALWPLLVWEVSR